MEPDTERRPRTPNAPSAAGSGGAALALRTDTPRVRGPGGPHGRGTVIEDVLQSRFTMTFANVLLPPRSCARRTKPRPGIEGRSTARGRASGTGARGVRLFPRAPGPAARSFRCALRWLKASECPKAQGIPEPNGGATCPGADALCRKEQKGDKDFDSAVPGRRAKFARSPRVCGDRLTRSRRLFDHPPHTHTRTRSFHHRKRRTQSSLHESDTLPFWGCVFLSSCLISNGLH